jgi:hypothetical protein
VPSPGELQTAWRSRKRSKEVERVLVVKHTKWSVHLYLESVAGRLGNHGRLGFNLARETRPLRNMKRQRPGAEERRVFVMHGRYAIFACVGIRIDLERIS